MKQSPIAVRHQLKLADSLARIIKNKKVTELDKAATITMKLHTSHRLAITRAKNKKINNV